MDFQIDTYLSPITKDKPQGENLKYFYDTIREAMREDDPTLPQGVWVKEVKAADWNEVERLCKDFLLHQTKDLQIAAWLTEAWCRLYGIPGLNAGVSLVLKISQSFWQSAYPQLEEDLDFRLAPFIWMNEKLSLKLPLVAITLPKDTGDRVYTFLDWTNLSRLKDLYQVPDRPKTKVLDQVGANKKPSLEDLTSNISKTPTSFFKESQALVSSCLENIHTLEGFVEEKIPTSGLSFFKIRNFLLELQKFINQNLYSRGVNTPMVAHEEIVPPLEGIVSPGASQPLSQGRGFFNNRDEAYQQIDKAANYLAEIEPHSPVPYLIKKAVSWRNKSFIDFMQEMMKNPEELEDLSRFLGLKKEI